MEQKYEGTPQAIVRAEGRKVRRTPVTNDWGLMLRWLVTQEGKEIATAPARAEATYELTGVPAGKYTVVLQTWKYVNYKKNPQGEFTESKFI